MGPDGDDFPWFSRTVYWVHVPDQQITITPSTTLITPEVEAQKKSEEYEHKMKVAAEKRTMVGLTLAFAVAVKHCKNGMFGLLYLLESWLILWLHSDLRGEEGM